MNVAIVEFPGSHGADATEQALRALNADIEISRTGHQAEGIGKPDVLIIPGGASYGDIWRPGALACGTPVSAAIVRFSRSRKPVLGIGNGFQILCELGVLPGALLVNRGAGFIDQMTAVRVGDGNSRLFSQLTPGSVLQLPLACKFGRYACDTKTAQELEKEGRVALQFSDEEGVVDDDTNTTGSMKNIAGVFNRAKTTLGVMCRPERAIDLAFGSADGAALLGSVLHAPNVKIEVGEED